MIDEKTDQANHLVNLLADLKEKQALQEIKRLLSNGWNPTDVMENCIFAMQEVGKRFETGRYFISALIMAGEIMRQTTQILEQNLVQKTAVPGSSSILLGTISGDIHDLGKNLFAILARCEGYHVEDMGVDVEPGLFVEQANKIKPDLIGISCMLTSSLPELKDTVRQLHENTKGFKAPVMIGGNCIDEHLLKFADADYWAKDAVQGIRICRKVFKA